MALAIGTNAGFVTDAPAADPEGLSYGIVDDCFSLIDTSPATATKITEMGWYSNTATVDTPNFDVALYSDDGNDEPETRLHIDVDNAAGTSEGWERVTGLNWSISSSTPYWLAVYVDDHTNGKKIDFDTSGGTGWATLWNNGGLPSDWGTSSSKQGSWNLALYAVWEAEAAGTDCQINIGDVWKAIPAMQINIGDVWKTVEGAQINIGDVWKTIF